MWCQVCATGNVLYMLTPREEQIHQQNILVFGMFAELTLHCWRVNYPFLWIIFLSPPICLQLGIQFTREKFFFLNMKLNIPLIWHADRHIKSSGKSSSERRIKYSLGFAMLLDHYFKYFSFSYCLLRLFVIHTFIIWLIISGHHTGYWNGHTAYDTLEAGSIDAPSLKMLQWATA